MRVSWSFVALLVGVCVGACAAPSSPPPSLPRVGQNRAPAPAVNAAASASPAPAPGAPQPKTPTAVDPGVDGEAVERVRVPLGGPSKGPASAKVNLVVFAEFECPFSQRIRPTLARLMADYPDDLRIFYRHDPMPFHPRAPLAAEAAVAAGAQGKFWQMHDRIYDGQSSLERASLERYAREVGLDLAKFQAALDNHAGQSIVQADAELASKIHVPGTPTVFANGRVIRGAVSYDEFKRVVDEEMARADVLLARGVAPAELYAAVTRSAADVVRPNDAVMVASDTVYKVPAGDAPRRGGAAPKVTIVEFGDLQCPFCARVAPVLKQLLQDYGDDVALLFRHHPLAMHPQAMLAAQASEAAREQGKFWEMHDRLFADQDNLDRAGLERAAREIGLDMAAFQRSMHKDAGLDRIQRDQTEAARFGAVGTPTFFINGREFRGAQPIEGFKRAIDDEIKNADAKLAAGTPRARLYAALIDRGLDKAPPAPPSPNQPDTTRRYRAEIQGAPVQGAKDALVTIVEWADFECPFCARSEKTLAAILKEYKGRVRRVWRDLPLAFHTHARSAAVAARAAAEQGKFWDMHDKLMADQEHLDRDTFEKYARAMHLDMNRFARALGEDRVEQAIDSDVAAGTRLGVRGTPIFYINGKYLGGAQPLESFKAIIDDELDTARALVADGTPKARVYETLMKDAEPEAVYARGDGKPEDIFQGQIIITKTRLPLRFPSRAAFVKALEDERIYEIGANNESGWDIEYIAFFAAPLVQDSVELKFYDLTGGRSRYVAGDPQYPHDPNERMFVSSVGLSKSEFEAGKNYRMTLEADHKVIASTTLWLRDRPASPREPAAAR